MKDYLFYDGPYDAVQKMIAASGKRYKEVACAVYSGKSMEVAKSLLSRALSPENTDVHLNIENLEVIMAECRPDDYIFYLCDKHGFDRPAKKAKKDLQRVIQSEVQLINEKLQRIIRQLPQLNSDDQD
jgi:hypothetical protein